jgi:D-beta-D-heptose 7-phosphate kinase/D-beta-D-heptose 1-phosphate adenosyltransferase
MRKTVWLNGTFDVLHIGHIKLFQFAKYYGIDQDYDDYVNYVVVGIDSDKRIKELKGDRRPINKQDFRKEFLECIRYVDEVRIFNSEQELVDTIKSVKPDIAIWGDEYKDKRKIGAEWVKEIVYFEKLEGYSSTSILNKIT